MAGHQPPLSGPDRLRQITAALWLVWVSVAFGIVSGAVSVTAGLADRSLSVLAAGLGVLADVTGSAVLIWRFRAERRQPGRSQATEAHAAIVVTAALAIVSAVITIGARGARGPGRRLRDSAFGEPLGSGSAGVGGAAQETG
jgi:predicted benzoate:H+ symporter BenE